MTFFILKVCILQAPSHCSFFSPSAPILLMLENKDLFQEDLLTKQIIHIMQNTHQHQFSLYFFPFQVMIMFSHWIVKLWREHLVRKEVFPSCQCCKKPRCLPLTPPTTLSVWQVWHCPGGCPYPAVPWNPWGWLLHSGDWENWVKISGIIWAVLSTTLSTLVDNEKGNNPTKTGRQR